MQNAYKKNTTDIFEDGPIVFDDTTQFPNAKFANQELYTACRTIYDFTRHRICSNEQLSLDNIKCLRLFYTVETGRVYVDKYELIIGEQIADIPTSEEEEIIEPRIIVHENEGDLINIEKPILDEGIPKTPLDETDDGFNPEDIDF